MELIIIRGNNGFIESIKKEEWESKEQFLDHHELPVAPAHIEKALGWGDINEIEWHSNSIGFGVN